MLDQAGAQLVAGDLVEYREGKHRFQFGTVRAVREQFFNERVSETALIALFSQDGFPKGQVWIITVYASSSLRVLAKGARVDWLLTLFPELVDTHDRAGADRLLADVLAAM